MFAARLANRLSARTATILAAAVLISSLVLAAKQFVMPVAQPAKSYPAHDEHPNEAITVAVDPYERAGKTDIFTVPYSEIGMLPLYVVVTNDGDQPVSLTDMKAQLVTSDRSKISPAIPEDILRRLSRPTANAGRSPLPFPTKKVKGGVKREMQEEIYNSRFAAKAVEPHATQAGFLFFDVEGLSAPVAGARFYLTGVRDGSGNEVMYFEVPLDNYLNAPAKP